MSKRKYQFGIALAMTIVFIGAILWKTGMCYESNDDRAITEILSGAMTGMPQARVIHENFLLMVPLTLLYRLTTSVPWYGMFLLICHAVSWFSILYCILTGAEKTIKLLTRVFLCVVILLSGIYIIGLTQFTSTAALLAVAGYLWIIMYPGRKKAFWMFFLIELLSFFVRKDSMLMISVMGGAVFVSFLLVNKNLTKKEKKSEFVLWIGILFAVIAVGYVGTLVGYSSEEWREHSRYDKARSELFDYYGVPEYSEVQSILERYGISQAEYVGFSNYVLVDNPLDTECLKELVEYQKRKADLNDVKNTWTENWEKAMNVNSYYRAKVLVYALWIATFILLILNKKISTFLPYVGLLMASLLLWGYLTYRGRMPERVIMPLIVSEVVFLMTIIVRGCLVEDISIVRGIIYGVLVISIVRYAYITGSVQYREVSRRNVGQPIYMKGCEEVRDYCLQNSENRYLLDSFSFNYYMGSIFETQIYGTQNCIYTGDWYGASPAMKKHVAEYLQGHENDFYLIVYDDGEDLEQQSRYPAAAYFTEKTGKAPQLADRFTVSHGGGYVVWYFGEK